MSGDDAFGDKLTRRTIMAGAAAGTLAMSTGSASAQRCPAPPHVKGPLYADGE